MFKHYPKHVVAKAIIWLSAAMLSLPSMPENACGCTNEGGNRRCCCAGKQPANHNMLSHLSCCGRKAGPGSSAGCCKRRSEQSCSCCCPQRQHKTGSDSKCTCGIFCTCHLGPAPARPALPPGTQQTTGDQFALMQQLAPSAAMVIVASHRSAMDRHCDSAYLATSLDRCINLSRFTL